MFHICYVFRECTIRGSGSSPSVRHDRSAFAKTATPPHFSLFPNFAGACINQPQLSPRRPDANQAMRYFGPPIGSCGLSARAYSGFAHHHPAHQRYPSMPSPMSSAMVPPCGVGVAGRYFAANSLKARSYNLLYP